MLPLIFAIATGTVAIHVDTAHRVQTLRPVRAMGTSVDSDPKGKIPLLYSPSRTNLMTGTGLGTLTYRLYTELSIEDWHWNPAGRYSDAAHLQGYWTSSADTAMPPIVDSFGYRLSHRGNSRDQGQDDDYSRIDDGDSSTYWKSNPYLSHVFTHEADASLPQWVVVQFLAPARIDAIRIAWGNPYATRYAVQYWSGTADAIQEQDRGTWHTFPQGEVRRRNGSTPVLRLSSTPVSTTAVRILMSQSSDTCDSHGGSDVRNCVGYAVQDIGVGTLRNGAFHDLVVRSKTGSCGGLVKCTPDPHRQTLMWTSSQDPWHTESDKVKNDQDQPGLDTIARSPITRGLPAIYPVALFYSTPQNAANELRYMEARRYPIAYVEMGEEVDGQYAQPEDSAALYLQFASAIHGVDPRLKLGGPVFEGVPKDVPAWRNASGDASWLHRFVQYLARRGRLRDFAFMSYEHYPYFNCDRGAVLRADLLDEPSFVRRIARQWRTDGVPQNVPLLETEDNFSADGTGAPQRIYGALWLGDFFGSSFASGISYATYYQAEPEPLDLKRRCNSWGAYNPYLVDRNFNVRAKAAAYYGLQLLTQHWMLPGDRPHGVYPVTTSLGERNPPVTAYSLKRPDGTWSVLVVNKDPAPHRVAIDFGQSRLKFAGTVSVTTFGTQQYRWNGDARSVPNPDRGLKVFNMRAQSTYTVAPLSLTVFRGSLDPPDQMPADTLGIVPQPRSVTAYSATYPLPASIAISASNADERNVAGFAAQFLHERGITASIVAAGAPAILRLEQIAQAVYPAAPVRGAYTLHIGSDGITIRANDGAGLFYGLQTLEQMFPGNGTSAIHYAEIGDAPAFSWRGIHLDVSRHFFGVPVVERYIDVAAHYKLNVFHWHLTDDQGWRIEIKRYPRLTQIASCRAGTQIDKDPTDLDGKRYCGYYTQQQIRGVVAYAKRRYVTIVPEIEMPGHSTAALAAYPQYACSPGPFQVAQTWGVLSEIYCPTEQTFTFLSGVLAEVAQLFPGTYVHAGGDEVPKNAWRKSAFVHALMQRERLQTYDAVQGYFERRIERSLRALDRRMVGWDEILDAGVTQTATVMSWRGDVGGIRAAKRGNDVVMSPDRPLYFDAYQGDENDEPEAIGNLSTPQMIYDYDPTPRTLDAEQAKHVLGVQGNLWTEYIGTESYLFYMLLPRELALSEIAWTPRALHNWDSFVTRTRTQYAWLDAHHYNYRIPNPTFSTNATLRMSNVSPSVRTVSAQTDASSVDVSIDDEVAGAAIRYTTDGSTPTAASAGYTGPLHYALQPGERITVTAIAVLPGGRTSTPSELILRRAQP